jgi:hypothetical protein
MEEVVVMTSRVVLLGAWIPAVLMTLELLSTQAVASKPPQASKPKILAQRLVEEAVAKHPEVTAVEIALRSSKECSTIADSELNGVGEKCDHDELEAMRTGEPFVEKESDGFDVTLPLHESAGKIIGTVGMDFKAEPGQKRSSVVTRAQKIVQEVEAQIPSTANLFEPVN